MLDPSDLTIKIESPFSEGLGSLIERSQRGSVSSSDARAEREGVFGPNAEFIVARLDGRPVGCIALLDRLDHGEARRLFVDPDVQGLGIAVALVEALEFAARDIGLQRVRIAQTEEDDPNRSETFRQLGFVSAEAANGSWMEKTL